jgi:hypothetical protein
MLPIHALIAQAQPAPSPPDASADAASAGLAGLVALLALTTLLVIVVIATLILLRRRALRLGQTPARKPPARSAWAEAGRRAAAPPGDDDETLDYDPRDLSPDDIGPSGTPN